MNKKRQQIIDQLTSELTDIQSRLETVRDEEREYYDAMPENIQAGEKGERALTAAEALESAYEQVTEALTSLDEAVNA